MAIHLSLRQAHHHIKQSTLLVSTDNSTVVSYLSRQSGPDSSNIQSLPGSLEYSSVMSKKKDKTLSQTHLMKFDILADRLSRVKKAKKKIISLKNGPPNRKLHMPSFVWVPFYMFQIPDKRALAIDAFTINWKYIHAYAFPPFYLIPNFLYKIRQSTYSIVLIPVAKQTLVPRTTSPVSVFSQNSSLKSRPSGTVTRDFLHPNSQLISLHAWELSNNPSEIKSFQNKLQIMSPRQEETLWDMSMMQDG